MSEPWTKEDQSRALKVASAHSAALRAARKVAMSADRAKSQATPTAVAAAGSSNNENVNTKRKRVAVNAETSEDDEDSEDSEDDVDISIISQEQLATQISTVDAVVNNELKPLAYETLKKVERIEYLLSEQSKIHQEEIKEQLADFYENQGQREREVVVGLGWGEKKERRNRRKSRETF